MEPEKKETDITYWHPAFYADIQIELKDDADNLIFENEHQLSKNPLEIDVLIIKKETNEPIKKNIGRIFRKYNIIEYKSPGDSLSVDDFYKVYGYACFYKTDVPHVNSIPVEELTITFVSEKYPRKLIHHLKHTKMYEIKMVEPGIYYIKGDIIPIQIIITRKLSEIENLWLKSLTNKLEKTENARKLIEDYRNHADNNLYRSVIETIMRANQKTFEEVNGMSDIFMEIVQEKFDRKLKEETDKAVKKAIDKAVEEAVEKAVEKATKEATKKEIAATKKKMEILTKRTRLTERISLIQKKCKKSKPLPVIADELEMEPEELRPMYHVISENLEKTADEIYDLVCKQDESVI